MLTANSAEQLDFSAQFFVREDDPIKDTHPYVRLANEIEKKARRSQDVFVDTTVVPSNIIIRRTSGFWKQAESFC